MNTKKAVWISKPEKMKTTLHSFSFRSESAHSVFFLLGNEGEITLTKQAATHTAFILLHTPEEYIVFGDNRIVIEFGNVRTSMPGNEITTLKLVKKGKTLIFTSGEKEILTIEKDAFQSSASFGFAAKGEGEVFLEVF